MMTKMRSRRKGVAARPKAKIKGEGFGCCGLFCLDSLHSLLRPFRGNEDFCILAQSSRDIFVCLVGVLELGWVVCLMKMVIGIN